MSSTASVQPADSTIPLRRLPDASSSDTNKPIPSITTLSSDPVSIPILSTAPLLTSSSAAAPSEEEWEAVAAAIAPAKRPRHSFSTDSSQLQTFSELKFAGNSYADMQPFSVPAHPPVPLSHQNAPYPHYSVDSGYPQPHHASFPNYTGMYSPHVPSYGHMPHQHPYSHSHHPMYSSSPYSPYFNIGSFQQWESETLHRLHNPYTRAPPAHMMYPPYRPTYHESPRLFSGYPNNFAYSVCAWSAEDDHLLIGLIRRFNTQSVDWNYVASVLQRSADACYDRFVELSSNSPWQQESFHHAMKDEVCHLFIPCVY